MPALMIDEGRPRGTEPSGEGAEAALRRRHCRGRFGAPVRAAEIADPAIVTRLSGS
jgi:hypothetical protein